MSSLTAEVFEELRPESGERDVQFKLSQMPHAYGDPFLIRQVLLNIVSNSLKFTRYRKTAVVEAGGYAEENENIYYVQDNGIGFDMKFGEKLFGLFQRIHTEKGFEGTGVGLVVVKKIIDKHGGRTWAEGRPGKGAKFYFALPNK